MIKFIIITTFLAGVSVGMNTTGTSGNDTMGHNMTGMPSNMSHPHNTTNIPSHNQMDHSMSNDNMMDHNHNTPGGNVADPTMSDEGGVDHNHMQGGNMMDHTMSDGNMDHNNHHTSDGGMIDHNDHNMPGGGTMDHNMHGMLMYFHFQLPVTVLFFGWQVHTQGQLAGACIAVLIFSVIYEGLKRLREHLLFLSNNRQRKYTMESKSGGSSDSKEEKESCLRKMFNGWHILFSLLQIIQTTLGMFLMLIYMTFNVWLAFSVSVGSGLGYFLFSYSKRSVNQFDDDHCL